MCMQDIYFSDIAEFAFWVLLVILFFAFKHFGQKYTVYIIHRGLNCATNENDSAFRWRKIAKSTSGF